MQGFHLNDKVHCSQFIYTWLKCSFLDARICQESLDDDQRGKYYCVYFDEGRYWGRLIKVFSEDVDSIAEKVEMKFLHYMCLHSCWEFPKVDDTKIVDAKYVFMGPCIPSDITKKGYKFQEDDAALVKYKAIKKRSKMLTHMGHQ